MRTRGASVRGVGVAAGVTLLVLAPRKQSGESSASVELVVHPSALTLIGAF
jgi:hypothetical protein